MEEFHKRLHIQFMFDLFAGQRLDPSMMTITLGRGWELRVRILLLLILDRCSLYLRVIRRLGSACYILLIVQVG